MNETFYVIMYYSDSSHKVIEFSTLTQAEKYISNYDDLFVYCEIIIGTCLKRSFYEET